VEGRNVVCGVLWRNIHASKTEGAPCRPDKDACKTGSAVPSLPAGTERGSVRGEYPWILLLRWSLSRLMHSVRQTVRRVVGVAGFRGGAGATACPRRSSRQQTPSWGSCPFGLDSQLYALRPRPRRKIIHARRAHGTPAAGNVHQKWPARLVRAVYHIRASPCQRRGTGHSEPRRRNRIARVRTRWQVGAGASMM